MPAKQDSTISELAPQVSVLLAAFRAGRYLRPALEGLRSQTITDWELIVVEDASADETEDAVRRFGASVRQPVRYENLGEHRGVAAARNRLLELARGRVLAFLDADDWWEVDHLAAGLAQLDGRADVVVMGTRVFDLATGRQLFTYHPDSSLAEEPVATLFRRNAVLTCSSVVFKRWIVDATEGFDPQWRSGEDRDFWLRAALAGASFACATVCTCHHAQHAGSVSAQTLTLAEQTVRFYQKHRTLASIPSRVRRAHLSRSCAAHARLARTADPRGAMHLMWQACRLTPLDLTAWAQLARTTWAAARRFAR